MFTVDPSPIAFHIPFLEFGVRWYGILFAFSFFLGYFYVRSKFRLSFDKAKSTEIADRLAFYLVMGTVIGARLGHIVFYDPQIFWTDPIEIFQTWNGGLASHGGVIGILIAIYFFCRKTPPFTFCSLLDLICTPCAFVGGSIRLGNFINQEILGIPSDLPWAVTFLSPIDGSPAIPRHPVQLYEALFYFSLFVLLHFYYKSAKPFVGKTLGVFLISLFSFRFFIEFFKEEQSELITSSSSLLMGQYLSLPFIAWGAYLYWRASGSSATHL